MVQPEKVGIQVAEVFRCHFRLVAAQIALPLRPACYPGAPWVDVRPAGSASRGASRTWLHNQNRLFPGILVCEWLDNCSYGNLAFRRKA